jgi:hypothetical protein
MPILGCSVHVGRLSPSAASIFLDLWEYLRAKHNLTLVSFDIDKIC